MTTDITIDYEIDSNAEKRRIGSGLLELISMLDEKEYPDTVKFLRTLSEAFK